MTTKPKAFGKDWTQGAINFPKHLTPEVIHSALYIHNADSKEESLIRVEYIAKLVGDETMTYVMSQLILPKLMNDLKQSQEYSEWQEQRHKKLN
jgi:hypothetical protein